MVDPNETTLLFALAHSQANTRNGWGANPACMHPYAEDIRVASR